MAKRSHSDPIPAAASATRKTAQPSKAAFSPKVFAREADYDQSVTSVVARSQSGPAPPPPPNE